MKFSVVQSFAAIAKASIPHETDPGVSRPIEFTCRFKSQSNEPGRRDALRAKQDDEGLYAFLGEVLISTEFKGDFEFEGEDGSAIEAIEWVKRNQFAGSAASLAFWDVINKDLDAKNSKRLRGR